MSENFHIHDNLILREQELFHRKNGLGFYHKSILEKHSHEPDRPGREIWLPEETQEVLDILQQGKSVLIEGKFSSGKSALLYGIRSTARIDGDQSYAYYDGHYSSTDVKKVFAGLSWADKNQAWVIWDSLDYLVVGSKKYRKQNLVRQTDRSSSIIDSLSAHIQNGGVVVATTHDPGWFNVHGINEDLRTKWFDLKSQMYVHTVRGRLDEELQRERFYSLALPQPYQAAADILITAPQNPQLEISLARSGIDTDRISQVIDGLGSYAIAKMICHDNRGDNTPLLDSLVDPDLSQSEKMVRLGLFVIAKQKIIQSESMV